jgi:HNH endonuclease
MRVIGNLGCLSLVLLFWVGVAWDGFARGDYVWGIGGVLGILLFGFGIVAELLGFSGVPAPAVRRSRSIPQDVKIAVAVRDQGLCQHCGTSAGPMEYDHVIPYSMGGDNSVENIQLLCRRCNAAKSNRYVG